jgi:DNA-binding NtrC family response regulator
MRVKVLVVKDGSSFCEGLREFLMDKGYRVEQTSAGGDALKAYQHDRPDVVLLDVLKPCNGGLDTLRELKAIDPVASVIMVTEASEQETAKQVMDEGAYEYIIKPINYHYLELTLLSSFLSSLQ